MSVSETRKPNFVSAPSDKIGLNLVHGVFIIKTPIRLSVRPWPHMTPYDLRPNKLRHFSYVPIIFLYWDMTILPDCFVQ